MLCVRGLEACGYDSKDEVIIPWRDYISWCIKTNWAVRKTSLSCQRARIAKTLVRLSINVCIDLSSHLYIRKNAKKFRYLGCIAFAYAFITTSGNFFTYLEQHLPYFNPMFFNCIFMRKLFRKCFLVTQFSL